MIIIITVAVSSSSDIFSTPVGRRSIVISLSACVCVCVSVCLFVCLCVWLFVLKHISGTAGPIFTKFCMQIPYGYSLVLLWWRYAMLCTSGFIDNVTCGHNGPYGDAWLAALRYRGGV